ncbi:MULTISPECIES: hypothetical protein [Bacteroidaceae]|jgi:hypothetical protein|uniref:hypothetical protein n=1 Tax=Bacteroidaceae TaxID=815 RepID=UPI001106E84C|nr:hypothetical protein [Bacteroides ovatus]MCS2853220.1 hypothetical protein [Bacteroides fragilis]
MKKAIITFLFFLCSIVTFAQSESAKPTFGVELDREVAIAIIEKETYKDVVVELKSADLGDLFVDGVKITVKDAKTGKRIYKKRFSKSYLYAFSDGTIQVGKGNALTQLILYKSKEYDVWLLEIRKKGIY